MAKMLMVEIQLFLNLITPLSHLLPQPQVDRAHGESSKISYLGIPFLKLWEPSSGGSLFIWLICEDSTIYKRTRVMYNGRYLNVI